MAGRDTEMASPSPDFLFPLVHDLRAPLRTILAFSALLEEKAKHVLAPGDLEDVARIRSAADKLIQLADALGRLAEASTKPNDWEDVDLAEVFHRHGTSLREREPQRDTEFDIAGPLTVHGAARHFDILAFEILHNAWIATRGVTSARIALRGQRTQGGVEFSLSDTGIGIPSDGWARLFRPFSLIHSRSLWPGAGLGLWIAQAVVRHYNGRIELRPNDPAGVRVECWFPA